MGAAYPPICGQVLCGQTLSGTWRTTWDAPDLVLNAGTFSISVTEGPLIRLTINRPVLYLLARSFSKQSSAVKTFATPKLTLKAGAFIIAPFLVVQFAGKPRLVLLARPFTQSLSASLAFNTPKLYLLAYPPERVGRPGLIPTIPESVTLTPSVVESELLVPTVPESRLLVPTSVESR